MNPLNPDQRPHIVELFGENFTPNHALALIVASAAQARAATNDARAQVEQLNANAAHAAAHAIGLHIGIADDIIDHLNDTVPIPEEELRDTINDACSVIGHLSHPANDAITAVAAMAPRDDIDSATIMWYFDHKAPEYLLDGVNSLLDMISTRDAQFSIACGQSMWILLRNADQFVMCENPDTILGLDDGYASTKLHIQARADQQRAAINRLVQHVSPRPANLN